MSEKDTNDQPKNGGLSPTAAGALAGLVVDISLFPLDTLKTRLQSSAGFWQCGGFRGIYRGVGPTSIGAAPTSALFFSSYRTFNDFFEPAVQTEQQKFIVKMFGAAFGEMVSCISRVPTDIVKQRRQADGKATSCKIFSSTVKKEGLIGMYRGFWITVFRDAPFSILQFPLWEFFKLKFNQDTPLGSAVCGAVAGAFAAGVTTPLDVIKTRKMLESCENAQATKISYIVGIIKKEKGLQGVYTANSMDISWRLCIFWYLRNSGSLPYPDQVTGSKRNK